MEEVDAVGGEGDGVDGLFGEAGDGVGGGPAEIVKEAEPGGVTDGVEEEDALLEGERLDGVAELVSEEGKG